MSDSILLRSGGLRHAPIFIAGKTFSENWQCKAFGCIGSSQVNLAKETRFIQILFLFYNSLVFQHEAKNTHSGYSLVIDVQFVSHYCYIGRKESLSLFVLLFTLQSIIQ